MSKTQQLWQELTTAALVGSERNNLNLPLADSKLGNVVTQLDTNDREGSLLSNAVVISLYNQAGSLPAKFKVEELTSAPEDEKPRCKPQAAAHFLTMMAGQHREVLPEWLRTLAQTNQRVPEELLPNILELGHIHSEWRGLILPVLGERGHWLAQQNQAWNYAEPVTDLENSWQTGNKAVRIQVLKQLHATDPAKALAFVESTWAEDKPEDRADFLETFAINLSMADEPLLERALDDKRKEVRTTAANLLGQLPESHLVQRMIERVKPLLNWKYDPKTKKSEIEVTLPEKCDKAMQRDGIEAKPPQYSNKGEKTWWLEQMLQAIPPQFWLDYWTTTPDNLVIVFGMNAEWAKILLNCLTVASIRHKDEVMVTVLLKLALRDKSQKLPLGFGNTFKAGVDASVELISQLIAVLPYDEHERMFLDTLEVKPDANNPAFTTFIQSNYTWNLKVGRAFLNYMRDLAESDKGFDYQARSLMKFAALSMPPALLSEAAEIWPKDPAKYTNWTEASKKEFMPILQFRADMLAALGKE